MSERRDDWPWFPKYAKDWLAATAGMSCEAVGAYDLLLCTQWELGSLPGDLPSLARIARLTPAKFQRVWDRIAEHFPSGEGGCRANRRLERIRDEQRAARSRRQVAGRRGASERWQPHGNADGIAIGNAPRNAGHIPSISTQAATESLRPPRAREASPGPSEYAVACCVAANRALEAKLGGAFRPLAATVEAETADAWDRDGVPLGVAVQVIGERITAYRPTARNRQPNTLRYFDAAVREAAARAAIDTDAEPELPDYTGRGRELLERPARAAGAEEVASIVERLVPPRPADG